MACPASVRESIARTLATLRSSTSMDSARDRLSRLFTYKGASPCEVRRRRVALQHAHLRSVLCAVMRLQAETPFSSSAIGSSAWKLGG